MRKIIGIVAAALLAANAFAGPFGDLGTALNGMSSAKSEAVSGTLPEGRDLLPLLWDYANDDTLADKVVAFNVAFEKLDPIENDYVFVQDIIFKFGIGLQKQTSKVRAKQEGKTFSVQTVSMTTGNVDKNGKLLGSPSANAAKSMTQNSKNIAGDFEKKAKSLSDGDWQKLSDAAFCNLTVQVAASECEASKLKAKKWYSAHSMEGKTASGSVLISNVDESKRAGFAYMIRGLGIGIGIPAKTFVSFYTNNDDLIDLKPGDVVKISGKVAKLSFIDLNEYYLSDVIVEEE